MNPHDEKHKKRINRYLDKINGHFDALVTEISIIVVNQKVSEKIFRFRDYKTITNRVSESLKKYQNNLISSIKVYSQYEWDFANAKVDDILKTHLEGIKGKVPSSLYVDKIRQISIESQNQKAFEAFQERKHGKFTISERVWNITDQAKENLEFAIDVALKDGISAQELARSIKGNLNNPDALFRRVRDKHGNLVLSQNAKSFHPGQGVYRSAHKNALRLAADVINTSYRECEQLRISANNDVVGQKISLSPSHKTYDLCDDLAGIYPKDFMWSKWHVNCYSYDMEVFTEKGWQKMSEVQVDDKVWSMNPETFQLELVNVVATMSRKYKGDMVHFHNAFLSLLVTPEHKMIYEKRRGKKGNIKKFGDDKLAKDFNKSCGALYRTAEWEKPDIKTIKIAEVEYNFDDFCEFMAYYIAEGSLQRNSGICLAQQDNEKNSITRADMKSVITRMGFDVKEDYNKICFYNYSFNRYLKQFGKSLTKFIPEEIKNASKRQINIFLDAYARTDGSIVKPHSFKGNRGADFTPKRLARIFFTSSEVLKNDISELIMKVGNRPSVSITGKKGTLHHFPNGEYTTNADNYRISEAFSKTSSVFEKELIPYNDFVYDIELERNHTLYVMRNGKAVWGSNCKCFRTTILKSTDELISELNEGLNLPPESSKNHVSKLPDNFNQWLSENEKKMGNWKRKPSFMTENKKYVKYEYKGLSEKEIRNHVSNNNITEKIFLQNGKYIGERAGLHDKILAEYFNKEKVSADKVYMLGGAGANGKSSVTESGKLPHPKGGLIIDPDKVKAMIPEYQFMVNSGDKNLINAAANFVHEESSYLGKKIREKALTENWGTIIDGVNDGSAKKIHENAQKARELSGKKVRADYVSLDTDLSLKLAEIRAKKTGREVPKEVLLNANKAISKEFPDILKNKSFDELYLWDTNENGNPRLILTQINGVTKMYNKDLYERFLKKAEH